MPGMTNLPAPLASFTASLNSSSKKAAACFFEIGLSGVLTLSAMWAIILDLLNGVAIEFSFLLRCNCRLAPASGMPPRTIAVLPGERKYKRLKKPAKSGLLHRTANRRLLLEGRELVVEKGDRLDAAKIIFKRDVLVRRVGVLVGQSEPEKHAGNLEGVVHLGHKGNRAALADKHCRLPESGFKGVNRLLENRMRVGRDPRLAQAENFKLAMNRLRQQFADLTLDQPCDLCGILIRNQARGYLRVSL